MSGRVQSCMTLCMLFILPEPLLLQLKNGVKRALYGIVKDRWMKIGKETCTSQRIPVNEEACPTTHLWEVLASCSELYGASFTSPHSMFSTPAPLCPWQQGQEGCLLLVTGRPQGRCWISQETLHAISREAPELNPSQSPRTAPPKSCSQAQLEWILHFEVMFLRL